MDAGVYKIENKLDGRVYIGSSTNVRRRLRAHRHALRAGKHHSPHLQNAWLFHGEEAFAFSPLLWCELKDTLFYEERAIHAYKCVDKERGYNTRRIPHSNFGVPASDQQKAAMSRYMLEPERNLRLRERGHIVMNDPAYRTRLGRGDRSAGTPEPALLRATCRRPRAFAHRATRRPGV